MWAHWKRFALLGLLGVRLHRAARHRQQYRAAPADIARRHNAFAAHRGDSLLASARFCLILRVKNLGYNRELCWVRQAAVEGGRAGNGVVQDGFGV